MGPRSSAASSRVWCATRNCSPPFSRCGLSGSRTQPRGDRGDRQSSHRPPAPHSRHSAPCGSGGPVFVSPDTLRRCPRRARQKRARRLSAEPWQGCSGSGHLGRRPIPGSAIARSAGCCNTTSTSSTSTIWTSRTSGSTISNSERFGAPFELGWPTGPRLVARERM